MLERPICFMGIVGIVGESGIMLDLQLLLDLCYVGIVG